MGNLIRQVIATRSYVWLFRHTCLFVFVRVSFQITSLQGADDVRDPGIRTAGFKPVEIMPNLTSTERSLARKGQEAFVRISSVRGDEIIPESEVGLGPTFNLDSCAGCHAHPSPGGSSPIKNPQVATATKEGATNAIPQFMAA